MADPKTVERATALFSKQYGKAPGVIVSAPGRVNLIGEHTDYNDGFVMPLALNARHTVIAGVKTDSGKIRIITESDLGDTSTEFEATTAGVSAKKEPKWCNYIKGVILQFCLDTVPSFDIAVATDVPLGGGLSSSASLEVAVATFLEAITGKTLEKNEKALLCQRAENVFVGMPCGCMDQFISVLGKEGHALLLDCRSQETKYVPLVDPEVVLLVTNSNVKHELTGGGYAKRREQCYEAVDVIKKTFPDANIKALRDVTLEQLDSVKSQLSSIVYARARHVVGEDIRTNKAVEALSQGDYSLVGKLMHQSHVSLKDDYDVSCPELDILVEIALQIPGVYGSRMTGGGFGGCTITLLRRDALDKAVEKILSEYKTKSNITATCFPTVPGSGATIIKQ